MCRMATHCIPDAKPHIPPPPRWARRLPDRSSLSAVQEASLVGGMALAVFWSLAEVAFLLTQDFPGLGQ